jgi:hypothetical protein
MRRRSLLVGLGAALAGCSGSGDGGEAVGEVTPAPVPESTARAGGVADPDAYPGLDTARRTPRPVQTLELEPTRGESVFDGTDATLTPIANRAIPELAVSARAFDAPPTAERLDVEFLSSRSVVAGNEATTYDDPGAFVRETRFDRSTLVVLVVGVAAVPARLSVTTGGRTDTGRLFVETTLRTGSWEELATTIALARVRATATAGLLVECTYERFGEDPVDGVYVDP